MVVASSKLALLIYLYIIIDGHVQTLLMPFLFICLRVTLKTYVHVSDLLGDHLTMTPCVFYLCFSATKKLLLNYSDFTLMTLVMI